jgi:hypothetical protein
MHGLKRHTSALEGERLEPCLSALLIMPERVLKRQASRKEGQPWLFYDVIKERWKETEREV